MALKTFKELIDGFKDSDNTAVINRKEYRKFTYSYKQLYILSKKFSAFLNKNNIKKGDKIIVWNYNSIEYALIFLGAFLEGVIVVPIDLRSNIDLVEKIQKEVKAKIIFQTRYRSKLKKAKTVFTEDILDILEQIRPKKSSVNIKENDIAEIIYTSGTTGNPKGVILTNKNFISNVNALNKIEKIQPCFRFLSVLPLSHVFEQVVGLFIPLSNRSTIVYIKALKTRALFEAFSEEKITNMATVPRLLELIKSGIMKKVKDNKKEKQFLSALKISSKLPYILRRFIFRKIHKKFGSHVNYFMSGGAALDPELEKFYDSMGVILLQGYGQTETSPVLTSNTLKNRRIGSVGKKIPGVSLELDKEEVLAKGPNITQGYYKNPKKTKELFKDSWLKTGDLGYFDKDDFLFLKGRKKDLIVTAAGVNIYPEDIESILNKTEGVKDSCIISIDDKIHASLLLKKGTNLKKIIQQANSKLDSSQKIQDSSTWPYEDFPRTTTMKIKKFAVKETIQNKAKPKITERKNKLFSILSQLTDKKITKDSTLQSLGLSSVDRVELISLLEQEFNIEIDEENIFPTTKVKDLETIIKQRKQVEENPIFKTWALSLPIRVIRVIAQAFIHSFVRFYSWPKVEGKENLKGVKGPVIFTANHQSHFDTPTIFTKLPHRFSKKIAVAAWREHFFKDNLEFKSKGLRNLFYALTIVFNIYPWPQNKGFRKSLKYTGSLIDKGWNILIYPEGERSKTGEFLEFKQGIGIVAVETKIPVIPIRVHGTRNSLPRGKNWPTFGRSKIKIGKPIIIKEDSYIKAANKIEKAIKEL